MLHVGLCIAALFVVSITHWVYRWRNPKCNGKLPPGSMGLPLLGETLDFFTPNQTNDTPFIKNRIKRYGPIFRTSLVGLQVIVSTDSELSYMVFQQEGQSFESWYPPSFRRIFGNQNISSLHGSLHKYLKNMVLSVVGPESLKKMFSEVESVATRNLEVWASQETVELKTSIGNMVFEFMGKKLISYDPEKSSENLRDNFEAFIRGLISFPLEIPGTAYYKCLQGRKKMIMKLKNMLEERRAKPNKVKNDFFDYVLEELKQNDTMLTEATALDLMFALLFANFETTSQAITVAIKFLTHNPRALKELTEEHQKILRKRENPKAGLTWEEYKSMRFTFQVINETLRLASIVPVLFRKAKKDIKFKEYTIPSGWAVMVCPPAVHLDPVNYKDPLDFNPWRWEDMDLKSASKTFMAFGGGQRFCVGADFAKLQIAIFLHCLVTKYQWQPIKGGDIVRTPGLQFPNGFHVRIFEKET
ncbi:putative cytochrome P450 [Helianthus annuus]|uniref:Cytochrome P450 n=1 Tax=Helianthus annuus TaxID=4232 RepID=A0A251VBB6_HELAN|nr:cytochrome P450 87A3 [Helianthus annuus]KAF5816104.1 putative cytochrome P450 [Helianthus annuus]KAJ0775267.1 putative cytochrome P450 [Helianthus annuus]KAJ0937422.1 putative cytochrome P450 [Helianthus annuus]KAJ0945376.1 putative cytochrome P450 [Helianthus annuus]